MTTENNQEQPTVDELTTTINDLKTQLGQAATKATAEAQARVEELTGELEKVTAAREEALDVIRGNPDLISIYQHTHTAKQARKRLEDDQVDLAKDKLAHKKDIADSNTRLRAATIKELAIRYGCDAKFLEELNLKTVTQIENVAIALGAARKVKRVTEPEEPALVLDSGEGSGVPQEPTEQERLKARYPTMY